jgi:hypothetical protein
MSSIRMPQTRVVDQTFDTVTPFRQGMSDSLSLQQAEIAQKQADQRELIFEAERPYLNEIAAAGAQEARATARLRQAQVRDAENKVREGENQLTIQEADPKLQLARSPWEERFAAQRAQREALNRAKEVAANPTQLFNSREIELINQLPELEAAIVKDEAETNRLLSQVRQGILESISSGYDSVREYVDKGNFTSAQIAYEALRREWEMEHPEVLTPEIRRAMDLVKPENVYPIVQAERNQQAQVIGRASGIESIAKERARWESLGLAGPEAEEMIRQGMIPDGVSRPQALTFTNAARTWQTVATAGTRRGTPEALELSANSMVARFEELEDDKTKTASERKSAALSALLPNGGISDPGRLADTIVYGWANETFGGELNQGIWNLMNEQTSTLRVIFSDSNIYNGSWGRNPDRLTRPDHAMYPEISRLINLDRQLWAASGSEQTWSVPTLMAVTSLTGDVNKARTILYEIYQDQERKRTPPAPPRPQGRGNQRGSAPTSAQRTVSHTRRPGAE